MATKKMPTKKQEDWLKSGAPAEALDFLGAAVDMLSKEAEEGNIMYKSVDETVVVAGDEVVVADIDAIVVDETVVVAEEPAGTPVTPPVADAPVVKSVAPDFATVLADTVARMIKEYHTTVVEPLVKELTLVKAKAEEVVAIEKSIFTGSDFLPAAAIAAAFKKEFNVFEPAEKAGDVVMEKGKAEKLETLIVNAGDETQSSHLLADI